jgi:predicted RNA methylase
MQKGVKLLPHWFLPTENAYFAAVMATMYTDSTYLHNNPNWHQEDAPFKANKIMQVWRKHGGVANTVCEVGCGSGQILVQLAQQLPNAEFWGYDISPQAIKIAQQNESARIHIALQDVTQNPPARVHDLVLVMDVIEHLDNYFDFIKKIAPLGRYTMFHIPLDMCMWSLFREAMLVESKQRIGHIHNFTEDFIKSVLTDYGYKIIDSIYTEPSFQHKTTKQSIVNALRKTLFKIHPRFCTKTIGGYSIMVLTENPAAHR